MPARTTDWKWAMAVNITNQAMENMEYVRRLLEQKAAWIRRVARIGRIAGRTETRRTCAAECPRR
jgi:hypothetical protein